MNTKRIAVLSFAGAMAVAAALLAHAALGGGTPKVEAKVPPRVAMSEVLVADTQLIPGHALLPDQVRWQNWPSASIDPSFIVRSAAANLGDTVKGTVVRTPLAAGQPVTTNSIVHGNAAGFMAAMLMPGMRAISITISADSGAGGFILPNDHVDLILTRKLEGNPPRVVAKTILTDVRVLAVDQTFKQGKDTKTVIGKTATLEMTPGQAQKVEAAENLGMLALSLRPLVDAGPALASNSDDSDAQISVIRYGVTHGDRGVGQEGKPQ